MTLSRVPRYLAQARLSSDPRAASSPISQSYGVNFERLSGELGFEKGKGPELFVAYTANARVETLALGDDDVIVYDQCLGQAFNRLNDFALAEWPPAYVLRWGFKHLAVALAGVGKVDEAGIALSCSELWEAQGRPTERSKELLAVRSTVTAIQEYFVLAHELAHSAVSRKLDALDADEFDSMIDAAVSFFEANEIDRATTDEMMLDDEIRALEGSTGEPMDQSTRDAIKKARQAKPLQLPDYRKVLEERDTLREEILCDYIASLLTLNRFLEAKLDLPTVLVSILHAFHNLSSLTIVRDHANDLATSPGPSDLAGLTVRKSVWRILALHSIAGGDQQVHERFVEITNLHARTVGDQIIFILPFEFERALKKLEPLDFGEEGRHEVVESIRDFTRAQVALTDPQT